MEGNDTPEHGQARQRNLLGRRRGRIVGNQQNPVRPPPEEPPERNATGLQVTEVDPVIVRLALTGIDKKQVAGPDGRGERIVRAKKAEDAFRKGR